MEILANGHMACEPDDLLPVHVKVKFLPQVYAFLLQLERVAQKTSMPMIRERRLSPSQQASADFRLRKREEKWAALSPKEQQLRLKKRAYAAARRDRIYAKRSGV